MVKPCLILQFGWIKKPPHVATSRQMKASRVDYIPCIIFRPDFFQMDYCNLSKFQVFVLFMLFFKCMKYVLPWFCWGWSLTTDGYTADIGFTWVYMILYVGTCKHLQARFFFYLGIILWVKHYGKSFEGHHPTKETKNLVVKQLGKFVNKTRVTD